MDSDKRKKYKWSIKIENKEFLKIDTVTQNDDGSKFVVVFQDNGKFYIKMIDKRGKVLVNDFFINEHLGIDNQSIGIKVCSTALIVSSQFLPEPEFTNLIFISLYHKKEKQQYHFLFDYQKQAII